MPLTQQATQDKCITEIMTFSYSVICTLGMTSSLSGEPARQINAVFERHIITVMVVWSKSCKVSSVTDMSAADKRFSVC